MKKKNTILFGTILAVFLMLMIPNVNAVNYNVGSIEEKIKTYSYFNKPTLLKPGDLRFETLGTLGFIIDLILEIIDLFFKIIQKMIDGILNLIDEISNLISQIIQGALKQIFDAIIYIFLDVIVGAIAGLVWAIILAWIFIVDILIRIRDFLKDILD